MQWLELKLPPVIVVVLAVFGMYFTRPLFPSFPIPVSMAKWFALLISACACVFAFMALYAFRIHRTTVNPHAPQHAQTLVNNGVFAVTRNPMYVSLIMLIAAVGLYWLHSGVVLFVIASMLYLQRFQIKPEERILSEKFGAQFEMYLNTTPRWF